MGYVQTIERVKEFFLRLLLYIIEE